MNIRFLLSVTFLVALCLAWLKYFCFSFERFFAGIKNIVIDFKFSTQPSFSQCMGELFGLILLVGAIILSFYVAIVFILYSQERR